MFTPFVIDKKETFKKTNEDFDKFLKENGIIKDFYPMKHDHYLTNIEVENCQIKFIVNISSYVRSNEKAKSASVWFSSDDPIVKKISYLAKENSIFYHDVIYNGNSEYRHYFNAELKNEKLLRKNFSNIIKDLTALYNLIEEEYIKAKEIENKNLEFCEALSKELGIKPYYSDRTHEFQSKFFRFKVSRQNSIHGLDIKSYNLGDKSMLDIIRTLVNMEKKENG